MREATLDPADPLVADPREAARAYLDALRAWRAVEAFMADMRCRPTRMEFVAAWHQVRATRRELLLALVEGEGEAIGCGDGWEAYIDFEAGGPRLRLRPTRGGAWC